MATSTAWWPDDFPTSVVSPEQIAVTVSAEPVPVSHASQADVFDRQSKIPGHNQEALSLARILQVGGGGLGSAIALGLVRSGARWVTILDPDLVELTNLSRQLYYQEDLGKPKAHRLAHNLARHAVGGAHITGIALAFEQAVNEFPLPADVVIVGVDSNPCRYAAARWARERHIPAVFVMLSTDGMRVQSFLQGPTDEDACLWCALPNLDPEELAPCAAAILSSCFLAAALAITFTYRALMGWPPTVEPFNWREADLLGMAPDSIGHVQRRPNCSACAGPK